MYTVCFWRSASSRLLSRLIAAAIGLNALCSAESSRVWGSPSADGVRFDVPQWVEAVSVSDGLVGEEDRLVAIDLGVSIIVDSLAAIRVDQLVIEVTPRGGSTSVADYAPRTELASDYAGDIEVLRGEESTRSISFGADATYPPMAIANLTGSLNEKNAASYKYNRIAPMHLIAASGTVSRGRGVYFKFRSTDRQIIEGDRLLQITLRVPADWRGELLDVLIMADRYPSGWASGLSSLTGMPAKPVRMGAGRFSVAAFPAEDREARQLARRMVDAEAEMRACLLGVRGAGTPVISGPSSLMRHVSRRIDWTEAGGQELEKKARLTLHRALAGTLRPYVDREFKDLPADVRAVCLDYLDARRRFLKVVNGDEPPSANRSSDS